MINAVKLVKDLFFKQPRLGRDKAVVARNLSNKYDNKIFLNNISFVVYKGELFSVIGLSGSGKSTLLKSITGLTRKSHGEVFFFGKHPLLSKNVIGFSPQEDSFFNDLTILENIKLFSQLNSTKKSTGVKTGIEYLKRLKLEEFQHAYPNDLSGGQRKRLNIVLSCLHNPKLLILDEPFAGLDYYNRRLLWDFLTSLKNRGSTIILTTHLLEEAQNYSTRVLILKNGKKFAYGTFKNVKNRIRFNYLYHIKLSNLSRKLFKTIKHFTMLKKIKIIYTFRKEIQFSLNSLKDKEVINKFLLKKKQRFKEVSLREPNLDEVMLASK
jgi:ABC-2 type transport system ATP-binding protein